MARFGKFGHWYWHGRGAHRPWVRRIFAMLVFYALIVPAGIILTFRFVPVPTTPQMVIAALSGDPVNYHWRGYWQIAPALGRAVIGAEDQRFCSHHGFDWTSINKVIKTHERHPNRRMRGASTISQQAARSLFATPVRSWVRKGVEAYFTVLIEFLWPKQRILTVYLNLVDWGHGNFGAQGAARHYFGKDASALTPHEAARLAAILPNPDGWRAVNPGPYVASRTGTLTARIAQVSRDGLDFCLPH